MASISTRSMGMRRSWWATPPSQTARLRRLPVSPSPTTARRAWRDSDAIRGATSPAASGCCRRNTSTASRFWRDQQELERGVEIMHRALALFSVMFFVSAAVSAKAQISSMSHAHGGNLYMQTNEVRNVVVHYRWSVSGTLTEVERVATGGAGSGELSPIYHTKRPNDFEGAGSVILTPDRRFLFTTNAGDNSVSRFAVSGDGELTLVAPKRTGNATNGGAKSLVYAPSSRTLFVVHTFGPDHIRLMSVDGEGKLRPRPEKYSVNTMDWNNRVPTMAALSPDGKFLFVGSAFDELPSRKNPDGSLILWIPHKDGALHVIASNAPDPDGIGVFPVGEDGALREASF